ncbi:MAG TPA: MFS transporter [Candidatus Limnocylindrales bacterium]|nr:MFS transporter [Candidatus Limnocylindrales bacterium]
MRYLRLLRRRDFALLWTGATLSLLGDGLTWIALVWLVLELGGGPGAVGVLVFWYTAPVVIGGLGAGVVLDRFDRRGVLIADNLVRGLAVASIPLAATFGQVTAPHVLAVAAVYGLLYMLSLAGVPALIPSIVPDDELDTANAMETVSFGIGGILGPAVGGLLIGAAGAATVLALDALSYLAFVACLAGMRGCQPAATAAGSAGHSVRADLAAALRFVLGQPTILAITVLFMAFNVGEGVLLVLLPVLARDVLRVGAEGYGVLAASFTGGLLLGATLVGAVRWPWPLGRSIAAAQLGAGAVLLALIGASSFAAAALVLAFAGLIASPLTIWAQTIRMRLIPPDMRGRVFALLRTTMQSTPPLGGMLGGSLLALGSVEVAIAAIALLAALPAAVGLVHPALAADPAPATALARPSEPAEP